MNNRALTLSLVMAVIAVLFVQSYVQSIEDEAKKKFGTEVLVIKAKKDIKENETIVEPMLELEKIPKNFLEPAAHRFETTDPDDPKVKQGLKIFAGSIALVPIKKGEQLTFNKVIEPGIRTGLAPQIAPGRRAISLPVSDVSGVSKLIKPGDRVDLIAIIEVGGGKENRLAKTLFQDVVVLAVGKQVTNNVPRLVEPDPNGGNDRVRSLSTDSSFSTVTIEVEPSQAETIALIASNGDNGIILSLRNNDDTDRVQSGAVTVGDILGSDAARVQRNPANANVPRR